MDTRLQTALNLARDAGDVIRNNFEKNHKVEIKTDRSPVTAVDKQINSLVAETLKNSHPEDGFLGEEGDAGDGSEQYQWICDPLDGTKPFILGLPNSVFMLALSENGKILLSVVYDPYTDRMFRAVRGQGAFCNDNPIRVNSDHIENGYAIIGADSIKYASRLKELSLGIEPVSGTGYSMMMIARGFGFGKIQEFADYHDIGPGSLIIEEAGGRVTGLNGEQLKFDKSINGAVISNGVSHDSLLMLVKEFDK